MIMFDEIEYDGANVVGEHKHWHTLRCILGKPEAVSSWSA
jgi:hypothetical protein